MLNQFPALTLAGALTILSGCGLTDIHNLTSNSSGSTSSSSEGSSPDNTGNPIHPNLPAPTEKVALTKGGTLASKTFVISVLSSAFRSTTYYAMSSGQNRLDAAIDKWVQFHADLFGIGCNPWSSYTFADCNSVGMNPAGSSTIPYALSGSALRQLNKSRVCEGILDLYSFPNHVSVMAAAEKIGGLASASTLQELNDSIITKMHGLFFRGRTLTSEELTIYRDFNTQMKSDTPVVSLIDRYRALLLVMCEDPSWEIL